MSAFDSLDDDISCDDLAAALEDHVNSLEASGWDIASTAFICHSTGAIITRRWILNRALGKTTSTKLPAQLISIAGANHGSTLAQLGRTILAYIFRGIVDHTSVGALVLQDLDYGSDFLLRLNREWLTEANGGALGGLYAFSMGGDTIGGWMRQLVWQSHEPGSDSTVRISGANLNYSLLTADPFAKPPIFRATVPKKPVPHLVIPGYSHTGQGGIIDSVAAAGAPPFQALLEALRVQTDSDYLAVLASWKNKTAAWVSQHPDQSNSTIVFTLHDRADRPIPDSLILLQDPNQDPRSVTSSLVSHEPIQNAANPSSVSFYLNYQSFMTTHPHTVHIESQTASETIDYRPIDYSVTPDIQQLVQPNEFTYVDVTVPRDTDKTYALYNYDPQRPVAPPWLPFPPGQIPLTS